MEPRDAMEYDVVTVGAGPAGLSAAIRLKQIANEKGVELNVCVVEKGAEVGAHILSGNVFETRALDELFPNWKEMDAPLETPAGKDQFLYLTESGSLEVPHMFLPPELNNHGNYIISLSNLTRWLGQQAEELGVEIYPGFAADEVLYAEDGSVRGIATKDAGIAKDGSLKGTFTRGVELLAKQTLFAEGCRGSCSTDVIEKFNLQDGKDVQSYGLGIKEVWQVPESNLTPGLIQHTVGWPLHDSPISNTYGGTFLYHMKPNLIQLGMVVGLDYQNPYLNPYKEFQRWKHHKDVAKYLEGGECIAYGARCLNEGGYHAIPKLTFPGGALIGCSAGFLNSVKIKGTHTAMKSGMLAAESIFDTVAPKDGEEASAGGVEVVDYEKAVHSSWIADELKVCRNSHASFHSPLGLAGGMVHTALSSFITRGKEPWTLKNTTRDCDQTKPAKDCSEIPYPKPDGKLSFDLLTNLQRSGTSHDHDQPAHLKVKEDKAQVAKETSLKEFAGPEQRFCPAGVYEYSEPTEENNHTRSLIINAQNCVHCKCCSIKTPDQFIRWTVPEGGGGPAYTVM
eukprot:CAMPEP_0185024804 /NCGR_PEP_ID=MMETSP1103-20130426/8009_1 /TAXON_ID=36769 /ORGANISM="Paraphysomonas bandaiensis, Strain Caron Lab Isolate" /LENGTH=565 /DNA_ID=CAMNT_0027557869 /DNA_START=108 /DNA_END=1805 /DNA_ORIENTATION=+